LNRLRRELTTAPNLMSLSRIAIIFVSAGLLLCGQPVAAVVLGLLAGLTDYLDGYLARRLGQVTDLGAILDRLCDLIFESTWLVTVIYLHDFSPVIVYVYLVREFVVLSARLWCSAHGVVLGSTMVGKVKSNFLGYTSFVVYLSHSPSVAPLREVLQVIASFGIISGLVLSYWSAFDYLKVFARAYNAR
jgi:CDP-diacylglycerol--glycerol-3-phosphate 3-phosphatidyltransferase